MKYKLFTGGAQGVDQYAEQLGIRKGYDVSVLSFQGHKTFSPSHLRLTLPGNSLFLGWKKIKLANKVLDRNLDHLSIYARNLLSRNWHIIRYSKVIYSFDELLDKETGLVYGDTGWGVMMAIQVKRRVYHFDTRENEWYVWDEYARGKGFLKVKNPHSPDANFAVIGTNEINYSIEQAINYIL